MDIIEKICMDATRRDCECVYHFALHDNGYVVLTCEKDGTSYDDDVVFLYDFKGKLIASEDSEVNKKCGGFKKSVKIPEKYRYKNTEKGHE
jgi:hypothetical protein